MVFYQKCGEFSSEMVRVTGPRGPYTESYGNFLCQTYPRTRLPFLLLVAW